MSTASQRADTSFDARRITRPAPVLMRYYAIYSLAGLIAFPILLLQLYFRYHTLRYRFDDEGISVSWGLLFRKEVNLTYRRIQDINLSRNILQRWMGLATIEVQTASGSATAEVTIEGVLEYEQLRDFLYSKMRGARDDHEEEPAAAAPAAVATAAAPPAASPAAVPASASAPASASDADADEALVLLRQIRDQLIRLRSAGSAGTPPA
jgi:uncharacterized protein